MRILVLGGGRFVGRALVEAAVAAGHRVTTLTRSSPPPGAGDAVEALFGDRTTRSGLAVLDGGVGVDSGVGGPVGEWDAVFDTWSGAPCVVRQAVTALRDRVPYYSYVSSMSVYEEPMPAGSDESHPVVAAEADADATNYPADKRGAELAVIEGYGEDRCLLARAGLILGPREGPGRLLWWLRRIARGGAVLAPGPADLPLQYVDVRDLAAWMVQRAEQRVAGAFNAVSASGHTTMGELLQTCVSVGGASARLVWVDPEFVVAQGIEPWTELPIWLPPGVDHDAQSANTARAAAAGLSCRPVADTVSDTWQWLSDGDPAEPAARPLVAPATGRVAVGLAPEKEQAALAAWHAAAAAQ
jgi:nucleoside-diphosphate-sugar epimerase